MAESAGGRMGASLSDAASGGRREHNAAARPTITQRQDRWVDGTTGLTSDQKIAHVRVGCEPVSLHAALLSRMAQISSRL